MKAIAAIDWLRAIHAFRELSPTELKQIYAQCHAKTIAQGETLYRQGQPADSVHVILQGRFRNTRAESNALTEVGWGSAIGQFSFFTRGLYTETATAVRESVVLRLEWGEFEPLARSIPQLWQGVAAALASALNATAATPSHRFDRPKTLAIAHAGPTETPPAFISRLAEALDDRVDCQLLSPEGLGQDMAGGIALDDPQALHWLGEQEGRFDLVVTLTGGQPSEWARKTITEADEILLVGTHDRSRAGLPVALNPIEELALAIRGGEACRLALVHERGLNDNQGSVNGARRWLENRPVRSHHHVGIDHGSDYQRLVRFILGQSLGFIATGEGAFAAVNLGVIKALQASGMVFDAFGGTGGGAAIGACLAMGLDPDDIDAMIIEILGQKRSTGRRTSGDFSFFDGRTFDQLVTKHIPESDIADLRLPFYTTCANFSTGETQICLTGGLHRTLRINWPPFGALPPFIDEEGEILASGGLGGPPPIARMRAIKDGANFICTPKLEPAGASPLPYHRIPSSLKMRLSRLTPFGGRKAPAELALENLLARALSLGQNAAAENCSLTPGAEGDLLLTPPVQRGFSAVDWKQHGRIKDVAYQWGLAEIERLAQAENPLILATAKRK